MSKLFLPRPVLLLAGLLLFNACRKDSECPPGFSGETCSEERVPHRMRITGIELLDWPLARPDGSAFDRTPETLPDIALGVFRDTVPVWTWPFYYTDAAQGQSLAFTPLVPVSIDDPLARYAIAVWDWDPGETGWDVLGAVAFTPYEPGKQFPETIEVACDGCTVRLRLTVAYEWESEGK